MSLPSEYKLLPELEQNFLERLAPIGLDWITTIRALRESNSVVLNKQGVETILLPPTTALTDDPLVFQVVWFPDNADSPATYARAHFNQYGDTRENFNRLESQLKARFGEAKHFDSASSLNRAWEIGVFKIQLDAWPQDMKPEWQKNSEVNNALDYATVIVTLSSGFTHIFPDPEALWIVDALGDAESKEYQFAKFNFQDKGIHLQLTQTERFRTPKKFLEVFSPGEVVYWKSIRDPLQVGFASAHYHQKFKLTQESRLLLLKLLASRGPESSELRLCSSMRAGDWGNGILVGNSLQSLDEIASEISSFWGLPLTSETTDND